MEKIGDNWIVSYCTTGIMQFLPHLAKFKLVSVG